MAYQVDGISGRLGLGREKEKRQTKGYAGFRVGAVMAAAIVKGQDKVRS